MAIQKARIICALHFQNFPDESNVTGEVTYAPDNHYEFTAPSDIHTVCPGCTAIALQTARPAPEINYCRLLQSAI